VKSEEQSGHALAAISLSFVGIGLTLIIPETFPSWLSGSDWWLRAVWLVCILVAILVVLAPSIILPRTLLSYLRHVAFKGSASLERITDFDDSYVLQSDLDEICNLGRTAIGDNHAQKDLLTCRLQKCPHIIRKVTHGANTKIQGYYIVYPLTTRGVRRIQTQQVSSGKSLIDSDICTNFRTAKGVYISMIFGRGMVARAAALFHLKTHLRHLRSMNSHLQAFFAKPSTKAGLRLLKKYGFRPIGSETGIWALIR
jgi:hypothetical protein